MIVTWHLIARDGTILRSTTAHHKAEARFRLAPIPDGASVISASDYANGYAHPGTLAPSTAKRTHRENVIIGLRRMREQHPEREAARREKISRHNWKRRAAIAKSPKGRMIQANIQRGLAYRAAKRQQENPQ
jgi:hypothetical protein